MANHKSAKKRILVSEKKRIINKSASSKLKTLFAKAIEETSVVTAEVSYKAAVGYIDKLVDKGKLHKNTGARKKSALTRNFNKLSAVKA